MNVNPIVISALSSLSLPVEPNNHTGEATEYITFNYADERSILNGDGDDLCDETVIRVNYYTKGNPQANKKAIRRLLRAAGFSIVSTQELYESDTEYTHVIVECFFDGVIDD